MLSVLLHTCNLRTLEVGGIRSRQDLSELHGEFDENVG